MTLPVDACSSLVKILQTAAVSFAVKCAMQISKEPSAAIELEGLDLSEKLKKPTLFPLASMVPLWLQRGTQQLIFELKLMPNEISSQETVAIKKSLLDDR